MPTHADDAREITGPVRTALNRDDNSIHRADTAHRLGFRGAAVGANLHLDIFAPLLVHAYGPQWFERGALSLYFLNVIVSGEPVQAVVQAPPAPAAPIRIHAHRPGDPVLRVCEGSASLGDHSQSELRSRDLRTCDDEGLRMLRGVKPGMSMGAMVRVATGAEQQARLAEGLINEPMDWYGGASPWGGPIASVGSTARMLLRLPHGEGEADQMRPDLFPHVGEAAGMFGAFEIAYEHGPVMLDRPYRVEGTVVGVGESPKTEYLWWDAIARDEHGTAIVRMRELLRFLKASSPLYPELAGTA
ncbi:MAG: hypothetical protein AB7Q97_22045 [Gammaproteobacteria bacterium]